MNTVYPDEADKKLNDRKLASQASPFARHGVFRNPFGELTASGRAELAVVDVEPYLRWLRQSPRAVVQVIGPCGHGKSTHLRALQLAWTREPAVAEPEGASPVPLPNRG